MKRDIGHSGHGINLINQELSRRSLLKQSGVAVLSMTSLGLLAACGDGSDDAGSSDDVDSESTEPANVDAGSESAPTTQAAENVATTAPSSSASGQITYAGSRSLQTIDPRLIENTEEINLIRLVTEPLVSLGPGLEVIPLLASSWEPLDDTTWQLKLREGVTFHNGEPFNADAVKFTFDEYRNLGEQYPWFYIWGDELPQAEVVDTHTVNLKSSQPIASLPRNLVLMYMLPPEAAAKDDFVDNLVGTGPYTFVKHEKGVEFELAANPDYWGDPPSIGTITYRPIPDASARLTAIQTGEVDIVEKISPDFVSSLRESENLTVYQEPGVRIAHYPFNFRNQDSPIADVRVRRALTYAINGGSIMEAILSGAAQAIQGPTPATLFAAADLGGYPEQDLEQVSSLLSEAGYPDDYELTMIFTSGQFIKDIEVTEALQAMLTEAGVKANIETLEGGAYSERRDTADWDIAPNGFSAVNGDPGFFLSWATSPTTFGYSNEETRGLITEALETVDSDERAELFQRAQELYWEDVPYLWAYTQANTLAINNRVQGADPLANGWIQFHNATLSG